MGWIVSSFICPAGQGIWNGQLCMLERSCGCYSYINADQAPARVDPEPILTLALISRPHICRNSLLKGPPKCGLRIRFWGAQLKSEACPLSKYPWPLPALDFPKSSPDNGLCKVYSDLQSAGWLITGQDLTHSYTEIVLMLNFSVV